MIDKHAIGLIVLIIIFLVVNSFFGREDKAQTQRLIEVTQAQSEIIRVSALGKDKAKDIKTRNFALNTQLSTQSAQMQVTKSLVARGVGEKSINKQLNASKNSKTDAALTEAARNNRYDETFMAILEKQIADYQKLLQTAHQSGSTAEKKTLTASFESTKYLAAKQSSESSDQ